MGFGYNVQAIECTVHKSNQFKVYAWKIPLYSVINILDYKHI